MAVGRVEGQSGLVLAARASRREGDLHLHFAVARAQQPSFPSPLFSRPQHPPPRLDTLPRSHVFRLERQQQRDARPAIPQRRPLLQLSPISLPPRPARSSRRTTLFPSRLDLLFLQSSLNSRPELCLSPFRPVSRLRHHNFRRVLATQPVASSCMHCLTTAWP